MNQYLVDKETLETVLRLIQEGIYPSVRAGSVLKIYDSLANSPRHEKENGSNNKKE